MARAKKPVKDEDDISLDDAVHVLRQAMMDGAASPIVDASPGRGGAIDVSDDGVIELTAMVKPPKGYRSLEDYQVRGPGRRGRNKNSATKASESLSGVVDSMIGSLISSQAGEKLRQELQEAIRPVLRQWLASHLEDIVSDVLESELANAGLSEKRKSSAKS